ncbi:hypothetical protein VTK26DRAFT_5108 [Humicola hyalothermophila]
MEKLTTAGLSQITDSLNPIKTQTTTAMAITSPQVRIVCHDAQGTGVGSKTRRSRERSLKDALGTAPSVSGVHL